MDPALEESARSLGHDSWGVFRRVTLPHLRPALIAGAVLVALYTLRDFGAVSIMRFTTFTRAIYIQYQSALDRSSAAVLSLVLVALTVLLLSVELRSRRTEQIYGSAENGHGRQARLALGPWRWPALLLCGSLVSLALVLPAGVLTYWLVRALQEGPDITTLLQATRNSMLASGLAALITLVAATPLAVLGARSPGRWSRWTERFSHVGFALPGIVIALALVFFGIRAALPLYQTLPMLLLAYLILFLPQAVGALRSSMLQVPVILEEAGRSLGRGPISVFLRVTLPLVRPGLVAGAALVFLTTMKELQATLILSPFGFNTLATEVWSAVSEAFFARAAGPALLLILVSSLPMAYFALRDDD
jgi:iron(III) transport system permease protein